ncbi:hypothetical protein IFM89_037884, partial [Coptis chinensis]
MVKKSRRGPKSRSSQYRGVTFYRRTGRWESHICGFDTAHVVARAYDRAAIKFRGVAKDGVSEIFALGIAIGSLAPEVNRPSGVEKLVFIERDDFVWGYMTSSYASLLSLELAMCLSLSALMWAFEANRVCWLVARCYSVV